MWKTFLVLCGLVLLLHAPPTLGQTPTIIQSKYYVTNGQCNSTAVSDFYVEHSVTSACVPSCVDTGNGITELVSCSDSVSFLDDRFNTLDSLLTVREMDDNGNFTRGFAFSSEGNCLPYQGGRYAIVDRCLAYNFRLREYSDSACTNEVAWNDNRQVGTVTCPAHVQMCEMVAADFAAVLFFTTMVMIQTPALGFLQAGLIRRKNALSMLMQVITGMAGLSLLWWLFTFSLVFGESAGGFIGNPGSYPLFLNMPINDCLPNIELSIPGYLFASFQLTFAILAPLIITGSWAEKFSFKAFLVFSGLWMVFVYCPIAHWVWNPGGWLADLGMLDFAGGAVIHTATGVSGMVVSLFLFSRAEQGKRDPHNVPLFVIGAVLTWIGWYSFNGGSALAASDIAVRGLIDTHLSACAGATVFIILSYAGNRKWSLLDLCGGALAGLAGITAGSGFVTPWAAVVIGSCASLFSYFTIWLFRRKFKLDDVLDVSSLQGSPGIVGTLLVGFFSDDTGLVYGHGGRQLGVQALGLVCTIAWAGFFTWMILLFTRFTVGTDVPPEVEEQGLDIVQVGERAYDLVLGIVDDLGPDLVTSKLLDAAYSGDMATLKYLVSQGADPSMLSDYDGRTALHLAAVSGREDVARYLIRVHDMEVNARDSWNLTPLHEAMRNKHEGIIQYFREQGGIIDARAATEPLLHATFNGDIEAITWAIKAGVKLDEIHDYDYRTPMHIAMSQGDQDMVELLLSAGCRQDVADRWNKTPFDYDHGTIQVNMRKEDATPHLQVDENARYLLSAVYKGDKTEVRNMLKRGVPVNATDYDGRTALHVAASIGNEKIVSMLLTQPGVKVHTMDRNRHTPLQDAAAQGHANIAKQLLAAGATKSADQDGYRLALAGHNGDKNTLVSMYEAGIDLNTPDYDGRTALHLAAGEGHLEIVQWLVANGARPDVKDHLGHTPRDDAISHGRINVLSALGGAARTSDQPYEVRESPPPGSEIEMVEVEDFRPAQSAPPAQRVQPVARARQQDVHPEDFTDGSYESFLAYMKFKKQQKGY